MSSLCHAIRDDEWSGLLFFTIEGDLEDPKSVVVTLQDIHLKDVGNHTYTEFDNGEEIIDMYDERPELMDWRSGLIHSHNTMDVFFSGEDWDELEINSKSVDFYLSVIVNLAGDYEAKIATTAKVTRAKTTVMSSVHNLWNLLKSGSTDNETETVDEMITVSLSPDIDRSELSWMSKEFERVAKEKAARVPSWGKGPGNNGGQAYDYAKSLDMSNRVFNGNNFKETKNVKPQIYGNIPGNDKMSKREKKKLRREGREGRIPTHVDNRQLDAFTNKTVGEDDLYERNVEEVAALMIVPRHVFDFRHTTGLHTIDQAVRAILGSVSMDASRAYASMVLNYGEMQARYLEVTDVMLNEEAHETILKFLFNKLPKDQPKITPIISAIAEEMMDIFERGETLNEFNDGSTD